MKLYCVLINILFIVSISYAQNISVSKDTLKYLKNPTTFFNESDSLYIYNIDSQNRILRIDSANNVNYLYNYDVRYYSNDSLVRSGYIGYYKDIFPGTDIFPLDIPSHDTVKFVLKYLPPVTKVSTLNEVRTDSIYFYNNSQNRPVVIINVINDIPLSVDENNNIPINYSLSQNYPNPFNPATTILYSIPYSNHVTLEVYNILGQRIKKLVDELQYEGNYKITFDASELPTGVYIYRLKSGSYVESKKMLILK